jgi:Flp pilus assembly protein TadD
VAAVCAVTAVAGILTALTLRRNEDYRTETAMWEDVVAKRPGIGRAHHNLSVNLFNAEEYERARTHNTEALRLNPDDLAALDLRAWLMRKDGRIDEALAQEKELAAVVPVDNLGYSVNDLLGRCAHEKGNAALAVTAYRKALQSRPPDGDVRLALALALEDLGQREESRRELAEVVKAEPNLASKKAREARRDALGATPEKKHLARSAVILARQAVLADGDNPYFLDTLAIAHAAAGKFDEAARVARDALRLARARGDERLARAVKRRLELFERGLPYCLEVVRRDDANE